jgi:hypothetical protein
LDKNLNALLAVDWSVYRAVGNDRYFSLLARSQS